MSNISFRPAEESDRSFLLQVYGESRAHEMAIVPWSDKEKADFIEMQFRAQDTHYKTHFPDCQFLVILDDDQPIGRLYVDRRDNEHRVVDIALLTDRRGQGIGGRIMQDLIDEAFAAGKPVRIHVEKNNPALRLYERLGFQSIEDVGVYWLMECTPKS